MILTDREITIALDKRQLIIDPRPDETALSSTTIDLTLAENGLEWVALGGLNIRPGHAVMITPKRRSNCRKPSVCTIMN
jgi:deoxycytidine triphosphate deaminase